MTPKTSWRAVPPNSGVTRIGAHGKARPRAPRHRRLRTIGWIVLAIGIAAAGLTYWIETRHAGPTIDELLPGSLKATRRQMGILYGTVGVMLVDWGEDLKDPGTHAFLIVVACVIAAAVCFHLARLAEDNDGHGGKP